MRHPEVVAFFCRMLRPQLYVELGVYLGETFNEAKKNCGRAIGVDRIDRGIPGVMVCTTDEFFESFEDSIDVAFIDADHCFENVKNDFQNVVKRLNPGGVVILHDTDPVVDTLFDFGYCGDSYRIVDWLEGSLEFNVVTFPIAEAGVSIVTRKFDTRTHRRRNG